MSRFYVTPSSIKGNSIYISGSEAHHILDVMRLKRGDRIVTFDSKGKEYEGVIENIAKKEIVVEILHTREVAIAEKINITLVQAIPKGVKIDFIIEKSVELGVDEIMPINSARTVVRLNKQRQESRYNRWQRIALSASKQCGRLRLPIVYPVMEFIDAIKRTKDYDLALMACLHRDAQSLKKTITNFKGKRLIVFIGPEGDFTDGEVETAKAEGSKLVSLGPRTLRVDTAAINILSILEYELGASAEFPAKGI